MTAPENSEAKAKGSEVPKEFIDEIMAEMELKGGAKRRLVKMLAARYNCDRQKVIYKLKRALITERYQKTQH